MNSMVPTTVVPIFADSNSDCILFPPFKIIEDTVIGGTRGTVNELIEFIDKGEITQTPRWPAQRDYELWVDIYMRPHYWPTKKILPEFRAAAKRLLEHAERLLFTNRYNDTTEITREALNALYILNGE